MFHSFMTFEMFNSNKYTLSICKVNVYVGKTSERYCLQGLSQCPRYVLQCVNTKVKRTTTPTNSSIPVTSVFAQTEKLSVPKRFAKVRHIVS